MFLTTNRLKYSWIVTERFLMAFISDVFLIFSVCFLPPSLHSLIHHPFSYAFSYLRNVTLLFQALLPKNIWIHRSFFSRNLFEMIWGISENNTYVRHWKTIFFRHFMSTLFQLFLQSEFSVSVNTITNLLTQLRLGPLLTIG